MRIPLGRSWTWSAITIAAALSVFAAAPLIHAPTPTGGIVISPNAVFRPSQSWADIQFASEQTFLIEVATLPAGVRFDSVSFGVEKIPRRLPRADITIQMWAPLADTGATAIEFVAATTPGDTMWFNVSGLRPDSVYDVHVDSAWQARSRTPGGVSFSWSFSATQTFRLVAYVDSTPPVAIATVKQSASVGEILHFDGTGSSDDTGVVLHEWAFGDGTTAQGGFVQHAYGAEGSYVVTLSVWDTVGNSASTALAIQVTPAAPDNIPPSPVRDLQATAAGPDYVVLEWTAPGDDGDAGQATAYAVRYRTVGPISEENFDTGISVLGGAPRPSGTLERLNVSSLASETVHWFAVRVADEIPNWSPLSDSVEVLTTLNTSTSGVGRPPSITGVWYTPQYVQLDVVFSKSMNRSSVMRSLAISPRLPFRVDWINDAHVTLFIQTQLVTGVVYLLTIEPHATDQAGASMGSRFAFQFMAATTPIDTPETASLPAPLVITLLAGLVGLATGWVPLAMVLTRSRRRVRALQGVIVTQAKRIMELRGRILPRKALHPVDALRLGARK